MKAEHRVRVKGEMKTACKKHRTRDAGTRRIYRCCTEFNAVNGGEVASDVRPRRLRLGGEDQEFMAVRWIGVAGHDRGGTGEGQERT
jgi:hypothetical protein